MTTDSKVLNYLIGSFRQPEEWMVNLCFPWRMNGFFSSMKTAIQVHNVHLFGVSDSIIEQTGTSLCSLFVLHFRARHRWLPPPSLSLFLLCILTRSWGTKWNRPWGLLVAHPWIPFFFFLRYSFWSPRAPVLEVSGALSVLAGWVWGVVLVVYFLFWALWSMHRGGGGEIRHCFSVLGRKKPGRHRRRRRFFSSSKGKGDWGTITQSHVLFRISSSKPDWLLNRQLEQEQLQVLSARAESGTYFILTHCCCCLWTGYQLLLFSPSEVQEEEGGVEEELHVAPDAAALAEMSKP